MISMRHLRYFVALAQHGHFGRAADACAISQPALSLQMKELEEILGAPLIERGARKIRLTPLGETFAERANAILQQVTELTELARAAKGPLSGVLRLGIIPTVAPYLLPQVMRRLMQDMPELEVQPHESVTKSLMGLLHEGRLDAAIVALPVSEPGLHEFPLFEEDFVLVRPASEARKPIPSPSQLGAMRLLLLEEGHCFRAQALDYCDLSQSRPRDIMEGSALSTLVQMVGVGIGVTLIPRMAVPTEATRANVALAELKAPRPTRWIGLIWRNTTPLARHLRQIGEIVAEVQAAIAGSHKI